MTPEDREAHFWACVARIGFLLIVVIGIVRSFH
jgi:hypothetical protein